MTQDKDKSFSKIDTSHLSMDVFDTVAQMKVQVQGKKPQNDEDALSWLNISQSIENAVIPKIQKPEILDNRNIQTCDEEVKADDVSGIQFQPGQAVSIFNDEFIKRTDLSIQIKDSLKDAINESAEATNTSSSAVIEASLRSAFPDSWESDIAKQFHEILMPREVLSVTRESYKQELVDTYSQIEFSLSDKLLDYLVNKVKDQPSFTSFDQVIEQALEFNFQKSAPRNITHKAHFDNS